LIFMWLAVLEYYLAAMVLAVLIDVVVGEPRGPLLMIHPVVVCGKISSRLFRPGGRGFGVLLWVISVIPLLVIYYLIPWGLFMVNIVVGIIAYSYVLKLTFSYRLMRDYAKRILRKIELGDLEGARALTQEIVRRNVWELDREHLISAVIESMAESFVDGFLSPLFYYALLGLPGALLQRLSNTMDSMVGYRGWPYEDVGWFSAMIDTLMNYIPARLSTPIITMAAALTGLDWRGSFKVALRDHGKVQSVNSGWPMSSFAGALNATLEKIGRYRINGGVRRLDTAILRSSIRLFDASTIVALIVVSALLTIRVILFPFVPWF